MKMKNKKKKIEQLESTVLSSDMLVCTIMSKLKAVDSNYFDFDFDFDLFLLFYF